MRLLVITALYPPAVGGAAAYFGGLLPELSRRDDVEQMVVLSEQMPGAPSLSVNGEMQLLRYLPGRASKPRRSLLTHAVTHVLTQLWFAARLPSLAGRHDIDLIHFHTRYRGKMFYNALQRSGRPIIADLRDKMTDPAQLVGVADRLLCCAEGVRRFAVTGGFPAERASLVPVPFEPPERPLPNSILHARNRYGLGDGPYLLFVGDMTRNKGVYDLLKAYRHWRVKNPEVALFLAGPNREGARFTDDVRRTEGARHLGPVPHRDVLSLMTGAIVLVLPSRSEGLPRTILEAVALGTKVVCPPGIPEFERHLAPFVLPEVSPEAIVETLERVTGSDRLPHYDFRLHSVVRVVDELVAVYGEALGE